MGPTQSCTAFHQRLSPPLSFSLCHLETMTTAGGSQFALQGFTGSPGGFLLLSRIAKPLQSLSRLHMRVLEEQNVMFPLQVRGCNDDDKVNDRLLWLMLLLSQSHATTNVEKNCLIGWG